MSNPSTNRTCVPDPDEGINTGDDGGGTCNSTEMDDSPATDEEAPVKASTTPKRKG